MLQLQHRRRQEHACKYVLMVENGKSISSISYVEFLGKKRTDKCKKDRKLIDFYDLRRPMLMKIISCFDKRFDEVNVQLRCQRRAHSGTYFLW